MTVSKRQPQITQITQMRQCSVEFRGAGLRPAMAGRSEAEIKRDTVLDPVSFDLGFRSPRPAEGRRGTRRSPSVSSVFSVALEL